MVTSGTQWMGFYFKDGTDQLFIRRGTVPPSTGSASDPSDTQWTELKLLLREPSPMPNACDLTRFLVTSLTFMRTLSEVSIWFDDVRLSVVNKTTEKEKNLGLPNGLRAKSSSGVMTVTNVTSRALHIKAKVLHWVYAAASEKVKPDKVLTGQNPSSFFSSLFSGRSNSSQTPAPLGPTQTIAHKTEELLKSIDSSIVLAVYSAYASVRLDAKLARELHRSTKKNAPAEVRVDLIYTGKDEYDKNVAEEEKQKLLASIFRGLRADLGNSDTTRIFIGHMTSQTTGLGGHMSAHFIPTVEREAIDLQDRNVSIWNKQLLYIGGYLARAAYQFEMSDIKEHWDRISDRNDEAELQPWLEKRATHTLRFFTFRPSQPSTAISQHLELGFFDCAEHKQFPVLSTKGIHDANRVRMPNPDFSFLETLAVAHPDIISDASGMVNSLRSRGFLTEVTFEDVLDELRAGPLSEPQMVKCLEWCSLLKKDAIDDDDAILRREFLKACRFVLDSAPATPIALSTIKTFVLSQGTARIIVNGPLPNNTLPFSISRLLPTERLTELFGWTELGVVEWLSHVVAPEKPHTAEFDIAVSYVWAARVLDCLAKCLPGLCQAEKDDVVLRLSRMACVPTKTGMVIPGQAYFANVDLFPDLPIVALPEKQAVRGNLEKLLELMGVRRHIDLLLLFERMLSGSERNTYQLIKYLCSVQSTLSESEWKILETKEAFSREGAKGEGNLAVGQTSSTMFALRDLYEPLEIFRAMNLPLLQWEIHKWQSNNEEAQFLAKVGLRKFPSLETLLQIASGAETKSASTALGYLLDNVGFDQPYERYDPRDFRNLKFIPAVKPDGTKSMESPLDVYANANCAIMGFTVLGETLSSEAGKLHIKEYPDPGTLIATLSSNPPTDRSAAQDCFEFLASRIRDFQPSDFNTLKSIKFIPVPSKGPTTENRITVLMAPEEVYFGGRTTAVKRAYFPELFEFVNFGDRARFFLQSCGVADEPSPDKIASKLVADPKHFFKLCGGYDGFLEELRFIASNEPSLTPTTKQQLGRSPVLIATKLLPKKSASEDQPDAGEDDLYESIHDLVLASNAVINDDQLAASTFADHIFCAPQEDILESFYASLGSPRLSNLIKEEFITGTEIKTPDAAAKAQQMRSLILERLALFFYDMRSVSRSLILSWGWLQTPDNFRILTVHNISRVVTFTHGSVHKTKRQLVSASAKHNTLTNSTRRGPLVLSLSHSARLDMYEIAGALCRLILKQLRLQDSILLYTLLTTDLRSLKRRGYNVDRILQRRAAERRAIEEVDTPERQVEGETQAQSHFFKIVSNVRTLFGFNQAPDPPVAAPARKLVSPIANNGQSSGRPSPLPEKRSQRPSTVNANSSKPQLDVTSKSDIDQNVERAVAECRPIDVMSLHDPRAKTIVHEAQESYCDTSGRDDDLNLVDRVDGLEVYIARTIPDQRMSFDAKLPVIKRFLALVHPLKEIYKLPPTSVHIFLDVEGPAIAFNKRGSLFLNLRYYEKWHDEDVMAGKPAEGLKSWYFTLAHEIAHNLVQQHDAVHSFYFSAISQKYISGLYGLIQQQSV